MEEWQRKEGGRTEGRRERGRQGVKEERQEAGRKGHGLFSQFTFLRSCLPGKVGSGVYVPLKLWLIGKTPQQLIQCYP